VSVIAPDTIVAIATPPGRGAVGVVRVSGSHVPRIIAAMIGVTLAPRLARRCPFLASDAGVIDEGLALYFPAPASYTGEHVLELQAHGGRMVLDLLVERLLELGCRPAHPGEFTERAFLNGKLDLAQAEAIADLIDATTTAAARAAVRSLQGEFSSHIAALQLRITELRSHVEAAIDFPDEQIDYLAGPELTIRISAILAGFDAISDAARQGALLREGLTVVIAGKPNAGKSSLMNRLVGDDVAIVADLPGTTRDVLREHLQLDGLPLTLIDTAGLRVSVDVVEAEGVRRAQVAMARADRVLYVHDAAHASAVAGSAAPGSAGGPGEAGAPGAGDPEPLERLPAGIPVTWVMNKIDLINSPPGIDEGADPPRVFLSAKTGSGIDLLREHLKRSAGYRDMESGAVTARRRHLDALRRARSAVDDAASALAATRAFELFAEDLRLAQRALGEITGEFGSDDLLGEIFANFCIGK
jgi:tRNA modification GTPase